MSDSTTTTRGILFAHFIEPTHVGTGEGLGTVDRPVFRESTTGYPTITGATLKGAMRASLRDWDEPSIAAAFGADGENGNQGCILWSDLKLLFLPVRSLAGTFAWATSMLALARLERSLALVTEAESHAGLAALTAFLQSPPPESGTGITPGDASVLCGIAGSAILEGFALETRVDATSQLANFVDWLSQTLFPSPQDTYWRSFFSARVLVMEEDAFAHLCRESLPVDANIQILPETGVTKSGSLRYTEFLPAETVMYAPLTILPSLRKAEAEGREFALMAWSELPTVMQFGAEESKGKGVSRLWYMDASDPSGGDQVAAKGDAETGA